MAYPGICGNDNLQNSSDPFFHSISFDEIIDYVDNDIPAVGTRTVTGNQVPTADAGPDFTIPARTPFALTGTAGDADADDVLVYSWEQRDAGPRQDIGAGDTGNNPLFRVFPPTDDPVRTFPKLESLLQNTTTIGETLPVRTRTMNFRFVVRDNRAGGGAVNTDDMVINVINTGTPFSVIGPDGGESFAPVSLQTVDWHVGGTNANGIDAANVNIRLSLDGGYTFPILLAKNVPNDGNHSVVMPDVNTASARIKVEGAGNVFFDVSNADFTIGTPPSLVCSVFEHFDSVVAPALPAQWTTASSGAVPDWAIAGVGSDTTPNHAFVSNPSNTGESTLTSPTVNGPERIRFRNFYQTESNFDGGVLEVSSDGINFTDIIAAGGSFLSGGYNSTIAFTNTPLAGRNAWSGNSGDYLVTEVALPSDLVGQQIQFRWRMGTDQAVGAIGWRIDTIDLCDPPPPEFDFGDAPDPDYPTLQSNSGAAHRLGGTLFLGTSVDSDADGQPNATASGDDEDGSDDEHAVIIPASLTGGETISIPVVASTNYGLLNAWIDFNSDGDWDDAGEQVFVDEPLISGVNQPEFTVPVAVTPGTSYARFRLSTVGGLSPRGVGVDGEVEDYQVTLQAAEAPTVIDVSVNEGAETRSELTQVTVTFNRPVTTPDSAFELFQRGTNTPVNSLIVNASVNANDQTVVQLTFGAGPLVVTRNLGNTLVNGEYQLTIIATMISRLDGGGSMAANYHFGDEAADNFFRKYGDDNGNNLVDLVDFARFRASFGEGSAGAGYVRAFDSDNDSAIRLLDFAQFRAGFGN